MECRLRRAGGWLGDKFTGYGVLRLRVKSFGSKSGNNSLGYEPYHGKKYFLTNG